jgi:hypothetical protein
MKPLKVEIFSIPVWGQNSGKNPKTLGVSIPSRIQQGSPCLRILRSLPSPELFVQRLYEGNGDDAR